MAKIKRIIAIIGAIIAIIHFKTTAMLLGYEGACIRTSPFYHS